MNDRDNTPPSNGATRDESRDDDALLLYNPNQPRAPRGVREGGRFVRAGESSTATETPAAAAPAPAAPSVFERIAEHNRTTGSGGPTNPAVVANLHRHFNEGLKDPERLRVTFLNAGVRSDKPLTGRNFEALRFVFTPPYSLDGPALTDAEIARNFAEYYAKPDFVSGFEREAASAAAVGYLLGEGPAGLNQTFASLTSDDFVTHADAYIEGFSKNEAAIARGSMFARKPAVALVEIREAMLSGIAPKTPEEWAARENPGGFPVSPEKRVNVILDLAKGVHGNPSAYRFFSEVRDQLAKEQWVPLLKQYMENSKKAFDDHGIVPNFDPSEDSIVQNAHLSSTAGIKGMVMLAAATKVSNEIRETGTSIARDWEPTSRAMQRATSMGDVSAVNMIEEMGGERPRYDAIRQVTEREASSFVTAREQQAYMSSFYDTMNDRAPADNSEDLADEEHSRANGRVPDLDAENKYPPAQLPKGKIEYDGGQTVVESIDSWGTPEGRRKTGAELYKIFNGKVPTEDSFNAMVSGDQWQAKLVKASVYEGHFTPTFDVYTPEGQRAGYLRATFQRDSEGKLYADNVYHYLDREYQDKGGSANILRNTLRGMKALGVDRIETATAEIGRYNWARLGFNWPAHYAREMGEGFETFLVEEGKVHPAWARSEAKERAPIARKIASAVMPLPPGVTKPREFMTESGMWKVGKEFLLRSGGWTGTLYLRDGGDGWEHAKGRLFLSVKRFFDTHGVTPAEDGINVWDQELEKLADSLPFETMIRPARPGSVGSIAELWKKTNQLAKLDQLTKAAVVEHIEEERRLLGAQANLEPILHLALEEGVIGTMREAFALAAETPRMLTGTWDETKHPRGQPQNKGQFGPGGGGAPAPGAKKKPKAAKPSMEDFVLTNKLAHLIQKEKGGSGPGDSDDVKKAKQAMKVDREAAIERLRQAGGWHAEGLPKAAPAPTAAPTGARDTKPANTPPKAPEAAPKASGSEVSSKPENTPPKAPGAPAPAPAAKPPPHMPAPRPDPRTRAPYAPSPTQDADGDGVTDAARMGVPGQEVPREIPRLDASKLTADAAMAQERFAGWYERNPEAAWEAGLDKVKASKTPNVFEVDAFKELSPDWGPMGSTSRGLYNVALHQTANAVAKGAFLKYLDEVVMKLPPEQRSILVTSGGVAAGKGFALKSVPNLTKEAAAVWDAAGEAYGTENPWIAAEAAARDIKVSYFYADADPAVSWPRTVSRAAKEGRMVDAVAFAESYEIGARNFHAFHEQHKDNPNARFIIVQNKGTPQRVDAPPTPPAAGYAERVLQNSFKWTNDNLDDGVHVKDEATGVVTKSPIPSYVIETMRIGTKLWRAAPDPKGAKP